jgi:two-component system sensor histidine kinase DesK
MTTTHPDGRPSLTVTGLRPMSGFGSNYQTRWVLTAVWLVYLIQPVGDLFGHHKSALWIAGGLAITVAFCVIYVPVVTLSVSTSGWTKAGLAALGGLAVLACVVYGKDWLSLWIYVSAATGIIMAGFTSARRTFQAVLAIGACYTLLGWLTHDKPGDYLVVLLPVVLVGFMMLGLRIQINMMYELTQARETVAKMATNEERLRLARDMHDITGQSLSMITLKSELASKRLARLPRSPEHEAIATELADIAQVSRQTLHDIREAVSGYHRPTLAIELIAGRAALEAAGITLDDDAELILRSGALDADAEAALAWCLREAVTNVVRHSGARHCVIRLTELSAGPDKELSVDITDDGHGFTATGGTTGRTIGNGTGSTGNGLRNMSERLSAVGGRLALGPATARSSHRGFRLTATVPARTHADADADAHADEPA